MVQAIVDSTYLNPAPRRLTLGSDAYGMIRAALETRIAELDVQKAIAFSTDFEDLHTVDGGVSDQTKEHEHA